MNHLASKAKKFTANDGPLTRTRQAFSNLTNQSNSQEIKLNVDQKQERLRKRRGLRKQRVQAAEQPAATPTETPSKWASMPILNDPFDPELSEDRKRLSDVALSIDTDTDPAECSEYALTAFEYFRRREQLSPIEPYMDRQNEITEKMRSVLVDWLVEMQESFQLTHETLYLTVVMVDIYMSKNQLAREDMQNLGATAILLASKFYERYPPYLDDLVFVCDESYTREQFMQMEIRLVVALDFDVNFPVSYFFLRRWAKIVKFAMPQLTLARYVLELSLMEYKLVNVGASKMAAAALLWSITYLRISDWNESLEYHTGYKRSELIEIVQRLNILVTKAPRNKLKTIFEKYSHSSFFEVAKISSPLTNDDIVNGVGGNSESDDGMDI